MSFYSSLNQLHAALNGDELFDRLEKLLLELNCGQQFALMFHDKNTGNLTIAQQKGFDQTDLSSIKNTLEGDFPLAEIEMRNDLGEKSIVVGNLSFNDKIYGVMLVVYPTSLDPEPIDDRMRHIYEAVGVALIKLQILEESNKSSLVAIEKNNESKETFGDERLHRIVRKSVGLSAQEISSKLRESVLDFIGHSPRTDDITAIVALIR